MYKINKEKNKLTPLKARKFGDLNFREREHLQEWIADRPEVLEELLIIQKEFDGFDQTNERLDLLALDKEGDLVIIENKLDDSGKDVVWQALKYTSYCSTLRTEDILRIYQKYLDANEPGTNAKEKILEFLNREDDISLQLNTGDQKIFLVANDFRPEVTSTVLWLIDHKVRIRCFTAIPYSHEEDLFLQVNQIIPPPGTEEFMIHLKEKKDEEKGISEKAAATNALLVEFWASLKKNLNEHNITLIDRVTPKSEWNIGSYSGQGRYNYCIGRGSIRVELYFGNDKDKSIFDAISQYREEVDSRLPNKLLWDRKEGKKASRVALEIAPEEYIKFDGDFYEKTNWNDYIDWFRIHMEKFYHVINPYWEKIK
ncbi:DUF4268 domain-containing protein [Crocinitomix algicola]|uniref:DUF4268 domain-containing protein n=1 Tax=Crocinitomix algicola TaxID=1740263 RepID=UPI0008723DEA|nr:DUF4268 domain-containing protein [Crocinitomix algicola]